MSLAFLRILVPQSSRGSCPWCQFQLGKLHPSTWYCCPHGINTFWIWNMVLPHRRCCPYLTLLLTSASKLQPVTLLPGHTSCQWAVTMCRHLLSVHTAVDTVPGCRHVAILGKQSAWKTMFLQAYVPWGHWLYLGSIQGIEKLWKFLWTNMETSS